MGEFHPFQPETDDIHPELQAMWFHQWESEQRLCEAKNRKDEAGIQSEQEIIRIRAESLFKIILKAHTSAHQTIKGDYVSTKPIEVSEMERMMGEAKKEWKRQQTLMYAFCNDQNTLDCADYAVLPQTIFGKALAFMGLRDIRDRDELAFEATHVWKIPHEEAQFFADVRFLEIYRKTLLRVKPPDTEEIANVQDLVRQRISHCFALRQERDEKTERDKVVEDMASFHQFIGDTGTWPAQLWCILRHAWHNRWRILSGEDFFH